MVRRDNPKRLTVWPIAAVALVISAFALGRVSAPPTVVAGSEWSELREIRMQLDNEQQRLNSAQESARSQRLEMARELGRVQAGLDRLDALGQTLAEMALIDDELFGFGSEPPRGGPEITEASIDISDMPFGDISTQLEMRRRQLDILEHLIVVSQLQEQASPQGWPVKAGWVSSVFGTRPDPFSGRRSPHHGLDFAAPMGSEIVSVASGVVVFSGLRTGYGHCVEINHGNGYVTRYAHNQRNLVRVGDRVDKGQVIAHVGMSGRATGPHLHFEVIVDGVRIDPAQFVAEARQR